MRETGGAGGEGSAASGNTRSSNTYHTTVTVIVTTRVRPEYLFTPRGASPFPVTFANDPGTIVAVVSPLLSTFPHPFFDLCGFGGCPIASRILSLQR